MKIYFFKCLFRFKVITKFYNRRIFYELMYISYWMCFISMLLSNSREYRMTSRKQIPTDIWQQSFCWHTSTLSCIDNSLSRISNMSEEVHIKGSNLRRSCLTTDTLNKFGFPELLSHKRYSKMFASSTTFM